MCDIYDYGNIYFTYLKLSESKVYRVCVGGDIVTLSKFKEMSSILNIFLD